MHAEDAAGVAAQPAELTDAEASPAILSIYDDIRAVLRVPFVDQLWRVLAGEPAYLTAAWRWLAPWLGGRQAERAADDLRRAALIPLAISLPAHKAFRGDLSRAEIGSDDRARISNFTSAAHYALPKLLLAASALDGAAASAGLASIGEDGGEDGAEEPLPRGVAPGAPRVDPIDPAEAFGEIPGLFAEIRAAHGYAPIADYYRSIARAGDFLRVAWNPLRPIVGDPEYIERSRALAQQALAAGVASRRASGDPPVPPAALRAWLTFYRTRLLPETLVEVTIIKGLTDGPDGAATNRYSLTEAAT